VRQGPPEPPPAPAGLPFGGIAPRAHQVREPPAGRQDDRSGARQRGNAAGRQGRGPGRSAAAERHDLGRGGGPWPGPPDRPGGPALWRVRNDGTAEELKRFVGKLRVHSIGHQDNTGPWIVEQFPDLFYILSKAGEKRDMREGAYRGMYLGGDESLTSRAWVDTHVRKGHGPLGVLYPTRTWTAPNPHSCL